MVRMLRVAILDLEVSEVKMSGRRCHNLIQLLPNIAFDTTIVISPGEHISLESKIL
jgi:hypothetical protein